MGLQPLVGIEKRSVEQLVASDWYDGPMSGALALSGPPEDIAFVVIALRRNPHGINLRLAKAWPLPKGTAASIASDPNYEIEDWPGGFLEEVHLPLAVGCPPERTQLFIAFTTGERIQAAWKTDSPMQLTEQDAERLLAALPLCE